MSNYDECLSAVLKAADIKGYMTFDDVIDMADAFNLQITQIDKLSEEVQLRGIILYESDFGQDSSERVDDYSQLDYDAIFKEAINISEELNYIIEYIKNVMPAQRKEIETLVLQSMNGNKYAQNRLFRVHMRVVIKIALRMSKQYDLDIVDAVSSGFMGLLTAIEKYDINGFSSFQSYASLWIQQHIQRYCTPKWLVCSYPFHIRDELLSIKERYTRYFGETNVDLDINGLDDFIDKVSIDLSLDRLHVINRLRAIYNESSMRVYFDALTPTQEVDIDRHIIKIYDNKFFLNTQEIIEEKLFYESMSETISKVLDSLTEKEKKIIILRFGLFGYKSCTLGEIGKIFNVTRERVRQIEAKALRKLRRPHVKKKLMEYY